MNLLINTHNDRGEPICIGIEGERIQSVQSDHCEGDTLDLTQAVVLPQLIESHNHPAPYNLSSPHDLLGDSQSLMGSFLSRTEWIPPWRAKSDRILAAQQLYRDSLGDYQANCDIFLYTSLMSVGSAVIQGFDADYYEACAPLAGGALAQVNPAVRESIWIWKPTDAAKGKTERRRASAQELLEGDPIVVHLAEGEDDHPHVGEEIQHAYDYGIMSSSGVVVVHGTGLKEKDLRTIAKLGGGLLWSPVSQMTLYGGTLDVPHVMEMGVRVGLGSDWALTGSSNILREMAYAQEVLEVQFGYSTEDAARTVLQMATETNAELLDLPDYNGIRPGNVASLTFVVRDEILPGGELTFENLDETDVVLSMHRGEAVFGDPEIMTPLVPDAEPIDLPFTCQLSGIGKSIAPLPDGRSFRELIQTVRKFFPDAPDIIRC